MFARLAWVFVGYATTIVGVSAVAYFADDTRSGVYAWTMVVGSIPVAAAVLGLSRHYFANSFYCGDDGGVGVARVGGRLLAFSALAGLLLALLAAAASLIFPVSGDMDDSPVALMLANGDALKIAWLLSAVAVAPFTEELLFRGVLLGALSQRWNFFVSASCSIAAFVAIHLPQLNGYGTAIVSIALLGVATTVARHLSRSIWCAVALHASYNLALALVGLLMD